MRNLNHIQDEVNTEKEAHSYIHLAPGVKVLFVDDNQIVTSLAVINVEGADSIVLQENKVSTEYNIFQPAIVVKLSFKKHLSYHIVK